MKLKSPITAVVCLAAVALLGPGSALAAPQKSASPSASASPAAQASPAEKKARAIPFRGTVSAVDTSAKTFTIAGKKESRVFKVTDNTTVTKDGASATISDISAETAVTGSYWKQEDGTLEAKTVKIAGGGAAESKTSKKDDSAKASPTASPKK